MRITLLADVHQSLCARGFHFSPSATAHVYEYEGALNTRFGAVRVCVEIVDWDFLDYPGIRLLDDEVLAGFCPHVNQHRYLCYAMAGSLVLNRYTPSHAIALCLQEAEKTLEKLLDPVQRIEESKAEFDVYWAGRPQLFKSSGSAVKQLFKAQSGDDSSFTMSKPLDRPSTAIPIIELTDAPWLDADGPPTSLAQFLSWLGRVSKAALSYTRQVLRQEIYAGVGEKTLLYRYRDMIFGVHFGNRSRISNRHAKARVDQLMKEAAHLPFERFIGKNIALSALHARNMPEHASLANKRITVVGVGAIGGYLAHALVRLGAGFGDQGKLTLIDSDTLSVDNASRHILGFDGIGHKKAEAMEARLRKEFFIVENITSLTHNALRLSTLFDCDILIDATGLEPFSRALNERRLTHLQQGLSTPPTLHVWINGNGEAVQGLFCTDQRSPCLMCLQQPGEHGDLKPRFVLPIAAPVHRYMACSTVTPYSVAAPMLAASLATQMIMDWQNGDAAPLFRTQFSDVRLASKWRSNRDPTRLPTCIACSTC